MRVRSLALPMGAAWHPSGRFFVVVSKDNGSSSPSYAYLQRLIPDAPQISSRSTATAGRATAPSPARMATPLYVYWLP